MSKSQRILILLAMVPGSMVLLPTTVFVLIAPQPCGVGDIGSHRGLADPCSDDGKSTTERRGVAAWASVCT
jgi:hypothetical protein